MRRFALVSRVGRTAVGVTVGLLLTVLVSLAVSTPASAQNPNPGVLPPNANAFGAPYDVWNSRWWQWALSIPADRNPLTDPTGANCDEGQSGRVWFLAGTFGDGPVTRSCTVRPGTPLFFPIINGFCVQEGDGSFDDQLVCAQNLVGGSPDAGPGPTVFAEIDGRPIEQLDSYYVESPAPFTVTLPGPDPDDNLFNAPPGDYSPSGAVGIYLMLTPLPVGRHVIHFSGSGGGASVDVTYNITVSPR